MLLKKTEKQRYDMDSLAQAVEQLFLVGEFAMESHNSRKCSY